MLSSRVILPLCGVLLLLAGVCTPIASAALSWHDDYATAYHQAKEQKQLLLVAFYDDNARYTPQPEALDHLKDYVLLAVPTSATIGDDEEAQRLLDCSAFRRLENGPGLAVVNLKYPGTKHGDVVGSLKLAEANESAARVVQLLEEPHARFGPAVQADTFGLQWHTTYAEAYAQAKDEERLLLIAFDADGVRFLPDTKTADVLRDVVVARLRVEESDDLLRDSAFRLFHRGPGIGLIDLKHQGESYGKVVQVLPSEYVTMAGTQAMIALANGESKLPPLKWLSDFEKAKDLAKKQEKMLLIAIDGQGEKYEPGAKAIPVLHGYVLLRQSTESECRVEGVVRKILQRADLTPMRQKPGLVIYDYRHHGEEYYGQVVSTMPYRYLGPNPGNRVFGEQEREHEFLILEPNTLSQRTLTWAIRVSKGYGANQRLRSADGRPNQTLMSFALKNSILQRRYGCGHHAGGPMRAEIASPGPGEDIVDGALNMVRIWRGSPPHYGTMVRYHPEFGYDMSAARSNYWYGTGRF